MKLIHLGLVTTLLCSVGCAGNPLERTVDNRFTQMLDNKANYTRAAVPTGLLYPGAIIELTQNSDGEVVAERVSSLENCSVPKDVIKRESGNFAQFEASENDALGLQALASLNQGASITGKIGAGRQANLVVRSAKDETIDRLLVVGFIKDPANADVVPKVCREAILSKRVAVIVGAIYVDDGEFVFVDNKGAEAKLTDAEIEEIGKLQAGLEAKSDNKAVMKITEPVYVAFRAKFVENGKLGAGTKADDATSELVSAFSN